MTPRLRRLAAAALLLGLLLFGLGRVALLPPFEGYDETAHYSYVAQLAGLGTWPARGDPMSAEVGDYAARAPTAPAAGGRLRYRALAGSPAARTAARDAAASPTADPGWRAGGGADWEAQHPPLYYALLAPAFGLADRWSLEDRLLLLRSLSYALAWLGLCCAARAAARAAAGERAGLAALAPVLWPVLLPEWFPEMARLGNDGLVALLAGLTGLGLVPLLARGRPAPGPGAHALLGLAVGLGLLAKATFLPLAAASGLLLAARAWSAAGEGRRARLVGLAAFALVASALAGWWYLGQILRTGDPVGANDGVNLAQGEGLWRGLRHHLSPGMLLRVVYDYDLSLAWNGTWSFVVPPLPFIAPLMVAFPVLVAAGLLARRGRPTLSDALAPLTLALFTAALAYYSLVLIAGGGLGQPAWYLHSFAPVLWPLLAWGLDAACRLRASRLLLAAALAYAPLFLLFATACDAAVYAGCAGTRGGDRYVDVPAVLSCWAEPAQLVDGLSILARPVPALALLGSGFALLAFGVALSLSAVFRRGGPHAGAPAAGAGTSPSSRTRGSDVSTEPVRAAGSAPWRRAQSARFVGR